MSKMTWKVLSASEVFRFKTTALKQNVVFKEILLVLTKIELKQVTFT